MAKNNKKWPKILFYWKKQVLSDNFNENGDLPQEYDTNSELSHIWMPKKAEIRPLLSFSEVKMAKMAKYTVFKNTSLVYLLYYSQFHCGLIFLFSDVVFYYCHDN